MSDIALHWQTSEGSADLDIVENDLALEDGLRTAVLLSLFTDRRAQSGDSLPDAGSDRRGWWADAEPVAPDDLVGSRLWLLSREKVSNQALRRAESYAREALQWMLDDKVAERIDVSAESLRGNALVALSLTVAITRPQTDPVLFRFQPAWTAEAEAA